MARYDEIFFDSGVRYDEPGNRNPIPKAYMIDLHRFFQNPFDDVEISIDELTDFARDHLQRMIAHNPGDLFAALITATTSALTQVGNTTGNDKLKLNIRKGAKLAKDTFRQELPVQIAKLHGAVVAQFGPSGQAYEECFGEGRTAFGKSTDERLKIHLQTLVDGLKLHEAALGAAVVADAQGLLNSWTAIYDASESAGGTKTGTQTEKKHARENLQLELFRNLLTLALHFPRQAEQLDVYMQQSLLEDRPAQPPEPPAPTPP
jgi:hypothetical protein